MPPAIKPPVAFTYNATTTSSDAVAAKASREYLLVINDSDTVVYLALGETAVVNKGIRLNANGGSFEMARVFGNLTPAAINCIHGGSGNKVLCGVESASQ